MPEVLNEFPEAKLVFIGYGPKETELKTQVKNLGLEEKILFVGGQSRSDLSRYYATADIFIGPSIVAEGGDTEGQPAAFIEAMASKTAIIASDVGGIKDMVKNEETGLLIHQKDPKAITKAITTLCKDSVLKQQLEQNAKEHIIKFFRWQAVAEQYLVIYENIDKSLEQ
jgi:glycosyltransferase involved in cell wall biosynthesis